MKPDRRAKPGTHYTGETHRIHDSPILRISADCPCELDDCPFDGTEYPRDPDMICDLCGSTLQPHPVEYELGGEWHVAHNLACYDCGNGAGCID